MTLTTASLEGTSDPRIVWQRPHARVVLRRSNNGRAPRIFVEFLDGSQVDALSDPQWRRIPERDWHQTIPPFGINAVDCLAMALDEALGLYVLPKAAPGPQADPSDMEDAVRAARRSPAAEALAYEDPPIPVGAELERCRAANLSILCRCLHGLLSHRHPDAGPCGSCQCPSFRQLPGEEVPF